MVANASATKRPLCAPRKRKDPIRAETFTRARVAHAIFSNGLTSLLEQAEGQEAVVSREDLRRSVDRVVAAAILAELPRPTQITVATPTQCLLVPLRAIAARLQ